MEATLVEEAIMETIREVERETPNAQRPSNHARCKQQAGEARGGWRLTRRRRSPLVSSGQLCVGRLLIEPGHLNSDRILHIWASLCGIILAEAIQLPCLILG